MTTEEKQCPNHLNIKGKERKWIRPDVASKCTWHLGSKLSESPHTHAKSR